MEAQNIKEKELFSFKKQDFQAFKPKQYYTVPESDEELNEKLQKIENLNKHLKYYDDIPQYMEGQLYSVSQRIQSSILYFTATGYLIGRIASMALYGRYYQSKKTHRKCCFWSIIICNLGSALYLANSPDMSFKNTGNFAPQKLDQKVHDNLEYKFDLFKDVKKLKYQYLYPSYSEVVKIENNRMFKLLDQKIEQHQQQKQALKQNN